MFFCVQACQCKGRVRQNLNAQFESKSTKLAAIALRSLNSSYICFLVALEVVAAVGLVQN